VAEPDDVGIDKQKILKNVSAAANEPPRATPAKPVPAPPTKTPSRPVAVPPPPAVTLPAPKPGVWDHRQAIATLVLCMIGVLWLVVGLAGKMTFAVLAGVVFVGGGAVSLGMLLFRKSA
jgi:hypothetical protein